MKLEIDIKLSPLQLAQAFADMDDELQAQFFIEAARIMDAWDGPASRIMQSHSIGRHLRDCACSTYEARALVQDIAEACAS